MFARAALRTTLASSSRCACYSIPRYRAVARLMSTTNTANPPPSTAAVTPPPEPSSSTIASHSAESSEEVVQQLPAEDENAAADQAVDQAAENAEELSEEEIAEKEREERRISSEQLNALLGTMSVQEEYITEQQIASMVVNGRSIIEPLYHPRTYGVPVAVIHLRSYFPALLQIFTHFTAHAASALGIPISRPTPLPIKRNLWTVIKSPFVHKKSQENFERKTYKRVIKAWDADFEVVNRWVMYLEKNMLAGVGMRVVKWERAPVGVGRKVLAAMEEAVSPALKLQPRDQVKALADKIIQQELASPAPPSVVELLSKKGSAKGTKGEASAQASQSAKAQESSTDPRETEKGVKADKDVKQKAQ